VLLYILKSRDDIRKFNSITSDTKVGISFHPESTFYLNEVVGEASTFEILFEKEYLDELYRYALVESHNAINRMDSILTGYNITNMMFSDIDALDTSVIASTIFNVKVLQDIIERFHPEKVICGQEKGLMLSDQYSYFASSSICVVLEILSKRLGFMLKIYDLKYKKNLYSYTLLSSVVNRIKKALPDNAYAAIKGVLLKGHGKRISNDTKERTPDLTGKSIVFIGNNEPLNTMADVARSLGIETYEWHIEIRKLYHTSYGHHDLHFEQSLPREYDTNLIVKICNDLVDTLKIDFISFNVGDVIKDKIYNLIKDKFPIYDLYLNDYNKIVTLLRPDLVVSVDTLQSSLAFLARVHDVKHTPWMSMFHGPFYGGHNNKFIKSRLYGPDIFCCDGEQMKAVISRDLDFISKEKRLFVTGNAAYVNNKVDLASVFSKTNLGTQYDILYVTTKLNTLNSSYIECYSNNYYIEDSKKIHNELTSIANKWKIAVKVKPMKRDSGLPEIYYYNGSDKIDYYNESPGMLDLLSSSNIVIIDSIGTTLLQALSLNKKVMYYNRDMNCFSDRVKLSKAVTLYDDINKLMKDVRSALEVTSLHGSINSSGISDYLGMYTNNSTYDEIKIKYSMTLKKLLN